MELLQKGRWVAAILGPGFFNSQTAASYFYTRQANAFATLLFKGMFELPHFHILIMNGCPDTLCLNHQWVYLCKAESLSDKDYWVLAHYGPTQFWKD